MPDSTHQEQPVHMSTVTDSVLLSVALGTMAIVTERRHGGRIFNWYPAVVDQNARLLALETLDDLIGLHLGAAESLRNNLSDGLPYPEKSAAESNIMAHMNQIDRLNQVKAVVQDAMDLARKVAKREA